MKLLDQSRSQPEGARRAGCGSFQAARGVGGSGEARASKEFAGKLRAAAACLHAATTTRDDFAQLDDLLLVREHARARLRPLQPRCRCSASWRLLLDAVQQWSVSVVCSSVQRLILPQSKVNVRPVPPSAQHERRCPTVVAKADLWKLVNLCAGRDPTSTPIPPLPAHI